MTDPHMDSSRTFLGGDQEFVDILEDRRLGCDLGHALRTFKPHPYNGAASCSIADLNKAVLDSQYLRYITKEVATETGSSAQEVRESASEILEEMSQNLQLGFIRLMGFTLSKVFKRLFSSIFVNKEGLNTLQQAVQENPVILMPNHRSYVDFLVISYILFTYDIPVPVIAAGVHLSGMKVVGEILRRSGAFFIRRSIGSDKLYWAVLSEYVKVIVRKGFAPLEFYVEGFRSRTLKSVTPKLGMMQMVLEPYFKGEVFDITLVPISISYDRVLEESLLAYELLGVPKPKETTAGLLKASKVLQEHYGSMHVNFGQPLSVRQMCHGKINRSQYNLIPRDLPQSPTAETQGCVSWLAHLTVRIQEEGSHVGPWSLMACLLLQTPTSVLTDEGLPWRQLTEKTLWLKKLALDFGARLSWPGLVCEDQVLLIPSRAIQAILDVSTYEYPYLILQAGCVYLLPEKNLARKHPTSPEEGVIRTAAVVLMLASYRNQSLHVFLRPAMLAKALQVTKSTRRDELFAFFLFLRDVFSNEFVFIPDKASQDFEEACRLLEKCGALRRSQQEVLVLEEGLEILSFLQELLQPFIDSYKVMFRYLCEEDVHVFSEKNLLPAVKSLATRLILSGELLTYEALSSDVQKNILSALRRLDAVAKPRPCEREEYKADKAAVGKIRDILSGKISPQRFQMTPDARL